MPKKLKPLAGVEYLAALLSVSKREIQLLANEGVVLKTGHGVYDVPGSITNYIKFLRKRSSSDEPDEYKAERTRYTRAKADEAEIRTSMIKGMAADMGIVLEMWADRVQQIKTKLLGLPSTLAGQLATETEPNKVKALLESSIHDSLDQLSRAEQSELINRYIEKNGINAGPTAETDGEPMG